MPAITAMLMVGISTFVVPLVNACLSAIHRSISYSLKRRAPTHPGLATVCDMIEDTVIARLDSNLACKQLLEHDWQNISSVRKESFVWNSQVLRLLPHPLTKYGRFCWMLIT